MPLWKKLAGIEADGITAGLAQKDAYVARAYRKIAKEFINAFDNEVSNGE